MDGRRRKTVHADAAAGGTSEGRQPLVDVHGVHVRDVHVAIVRRPHVSAIGHANRAHEVFRRYRKRAGWNRGHDLAIGAALNRAVRDGEIRRRLAAGESVRAVARALRYGLATVQRARLAGAMRGERRQVSGYVPESGAG